jgi:hypothetical protein
MVIDHINTSIKSGKPRGDILIDRICYQNIFEMLLFGNRQHNAGLITDAVNQHFQAKVRATTTPRNTLYYESAS